MTASAAESTTRARRARPGLPGGGPNVLEHILGRTLVVVLAVFVTQAGLM